MSQRCISFSDFCENPN